MVKNLENIKDKHTGSITAIIIGILLFISSIKPITEGLPTEGFVGGISLTFGAIAYRLAKKRKLSTVNLTVLRVILEVVCIVLAMLVVLMQNDLRLMALSYPLSNIFIPGGVLIAYLNIVFKK